MKTFVFDGLEKKLNVKHENFEFSFALPRNVLNFDNMYLAMDANGDIVIYESHPYVEDGLIWNTNNNYEVIGRLKDDESTKDFPFKKSEVIKLDKYEYYIHIYELKDYI